jgi:hypothetical protein
MLLLFVSFLPSSLNSSSGDIAVAVLHMSQRLDA